MVLDLALDHPRPRAFNALGSQSKLNFEQEMINPILATCPTTPYSVFFAAFVMCLSRLTGQARVHCAIPYGTRANPSLYPLIGSFLNMLPAQFEYSYTDSFGAALDRCSALQLAARKYALAPFLTVVNMLRPHAPFDPSRNPVYQSMCDMLPGGGDEEQETMGGVLELFCFPMAPNGVLKNIQINFNSTLITKTTANRCLMQMKAMLQIAGYQAQAGSGLIYRQPLPKVFDEGFESSSGASLGSMPLKIYSASGEDAECEVNLSSGFALKGTPDEYDFYRRSRRFARHSGIMPTTDPGHKYAPQYQLPPIPPKKKGQPQEAVALPPIEVDESYEKPDAEPILEWPAEDAAPLINPAVQEHEGIVDFWDSKNGMGLIKCSSISEDIPFYRKSVPLKNQAKGVRLEGQKVVFSYLHNQNATYAIALRFVDEQDYY
jgi:hypothetical protein